MAFDISTVNGLGTGILGDITISSAVQINSYANVTAISGDGLQVTIGANSIGSYGGFTVGQEILFHVTGCLTTTSTNMGIYQIATITAVNGSILTLSKAVPIISLSAYICQLVTIPNFKNLTVSCNLTALAYDTTNKYGGILALKCKETLNLTNGKILTENSGLPKDSSLRPSGIVCSNSTIKDKLVMSTGNGISLLVSKILNVSTNTRIGASWSGALGAGAGGVCPNRYGTFTNGNGQPGAISNGGWGGVWGYGGNGTATTTTGLTPGGAPGSAGYAGKGGSIEEGGIANNGGNAGASILIFSDTINNFNIAVFSTGGSGGTGYGGNPGSSGGNSGAGYGGGGAGGANSSDSNPSGGGGGGGGAGFGFIATNTALTTNATAYDLDTLSNISYSETAKFYFPIMIF